MLDIPTEIFKRNNVPDLLELADELVDMGWNEQAKYVINSAKELAEING